jgi:hypothetical protein
MHTVVGLVPHRKWRPPKRLQAAPIGQCQFWHNVRIFLLELCTHASSTLHHGTIGGPARVGPFH